MHAVRTQCKVLDVGKYSNPSFGPFSQVFGSVPGFFWLPKHLGCGTKTLVVFKVILEPRCSRSSIGMATSTTAEKSTWSSSLEGSRSPILEWRVDTRTGQFFFDDAVGYNYNQKYRWTPGQPYGIDTSQSSP